MTILSRYLTAFALLTIVQINAQDFQGVATYKSHRKVDLKMDEKKMNSEMQEQIQAQLRKQFQQEYTLTFTKNESIYKKNEKLASPNPAANSGVVITVSETSDILYKNIQEDRYTNETELYGKLFLIKDNLENIKWELGSETKNIGQYTCFKATYIEDVEHQTINDNDEVVKEKQERKITAWYTPQIPVTNGPQEFQGLPGLILEINDGKLTLVCSKIVLNPQEKIAIKEPVKGKVVTQNKFDDISEKKTKEMMDRFRSNRNHGDSRVIKIQG